MQEVDARTSSQFRAEESAEKACVETLWEEKDAGSQRVGRAGPNWKDPASRPFEKPAKGREIGVENEPLESGLNETMEEARAEKGAERVLEDFFFLSTPLPRSFVAVLPTRSVTVDLGAVGR